MEEREYEAGDAHDTHRPFSDRFQMNAETGYNT